MTAPITTRGPNGERKQSARVWLRIDKNHVAKVIKARRALCFGEVFNAANGR
ncbi:MAG: hypothetical protein V4657_13450 [Pseudomonadota bacterium]